MTQGVLSSLVIDGFDQDNDHVTYHLTDDSDTSVSIDNRTGVVSFYPDPNSPVTIGFVYLKLSDAIKTYVDDT